MSKNLFRHEDVLFSLAVKNEGGRFISKVKYENKRQFIYLDFIEHAKIFEDTQTAEKYIKRFKLDMNRYEIRKINIYYDYEVNW